MTLLILDLILEQNPLKTLASLTKRLLKNRAHIYSSRARAVRPGAAPCYCSSMYFRLNDKTASWEFHQYYKNCSVNSVSFIYHFQYKYNAASSVLNAIHSQINAQKPCCNNCSKHLTTHFVSWHWMEAKWDLRLSTKWLKLVKWIRLVQEVQKIKFNKSVIRAIIMNFIGEAW
jgi:hypothetical protein